MFKYNNQDHAIVNSLLAARTAIDPGRDDTWLVNNETEYSENAPCPPCYFLTLFLQLSILW